MKFYRILAGSAGAALIAGVLTACGGGGSTGSVPPVTSSPPPIVGGGGATATPSPAPNPTPGPVVTSVNGSLNNVGDKATITASEANYSGAFTYTSSNGNVVSLTAGAAQSVARGVQTELRFPQANCPAGSPQSVTTSGPVTATVVAADCPFSITVSGASSQSSTTAVNNTQGASPSPAPSNAPATNPPATNPPGNPIPTPTPTPTPFVVPSGVTFVTPVPRATPTPTAGPGTPAPTAPPATATPTPTPTIAPTPTPTAPPTATPPPAIPQSTSAPTSIFGGEVIGNADFAGGETQPKPNNTTVDGYACANENITFHQHTHLTVFNGTSEMVVPEAIGIFMPARSAGGLEIQDLNNPASCLTSLHTHDKSGSMHVENATPIFPTLGQFFDIWGQPLSRTQVANLSGTVRVYITNVDAGTPPVEFMGDPRSIPMSQHNEISIFVNPVYGPGGNTIPTYTWAY